MRTIIVAVLKFKQFFEKKQKTLAYVQPDAAKGDLRQWSASLVLPKRR
jgi:hypothetical protein